MSRKKFIGANWKMNEHPMDVELQSAEGKHTAYHPTGEVDVVVFPTFLELADCKRWGLMVGAQCAHPDDSGAFTGDVSMAMLAGNAIGYVLCGHSDRRQFHGESDEFIGQQVASAVRNGVTPVLCIGETASEHEAGKTEEVLKRQLMAVLSVLKTRDANFVIAYEPVWAISRGNANAKACSAADAQKAHKFIRSLLPKELQNIRIIYGGSMKGSNAAELMAEPDIDGGLVGGASLKPDDFAKIVEAATKKKL